MPLPEHLAPAQAEEPHKEWLSVLAGWLRRFWQYFAGLGKLLIFWVEWWPLWPMGIQAGWMVLGNLA
jgi:hypothetical protein